MGRELNAMMIPFAFVFVFHSLYSATSAKKAADSVITILWPTSAREVKTMKRTTLPAKNQAKSRERKQKLMPMYQVVFFDVRWTISCPKDVPTSLAILLLVKKAEIKSGALATYLK